MQEERNSTMYPSECRQGCGFYGSAEFDGYCSKCFKDLNPQKNSINVSSSVSSRLISTPSLTSTTSGSSKTRSSPVFSFCGESSKTATSEDEIIQTPSTGASPENMESVPVKTLAHEELFLKHLCGLSSAEPISDIQKQQHTIQSVSLENGLEIDTNHSDFIVTPSQTTPSTPSSSLLPVIESPSIKNDSTTPDDKNPINDSKMCAHCNRKVVVSFKCRCDRYFCTKHRNHDKHNCTFDYKTSERDKIAAMNPTVMKGKIDKF